MDQLLINKREAAKAFSISVRSIDRLIKDGKLPCVRIRGQVRIPVDALKRIATAA